MKYDLICGVPFSGVERQVERIDLIGTIESECIAIAVGAWLAGKNPLVFVQNSGLGNCVDIITSLLVPYGIKIDLLINNRNSPEHHALMGRITKLLMGIMTYDSVRYC